MGLSFRDGREYRPPSVLAKAPARSLPERQYSRQEVASVFRGASDSAKPDTVDNAPDCALHGAIAGRRRQDASG